MGYCYFASGPNSGKRICECCQVNPGRLRKCPYGYCQSPAVCTACWPIRKGEIKNHCFDHCKPASERFAAREAQQKALLAAGNSLRVSAMSTSDGRVHVIFRNGSGQETGFYMQAATYDAIPMLEPATREQYEAIEGRALEEAPTRFVYARGA